MIETTSTLSFAANGVVLGGTRLVAVGAKFAYSDDYGETWTDCATQPAVEFDAVTYGQSKFVAVTSNGSGNARVFESSDGNTWVATFPVSIVS